MKKLISFALAATALFAQALPAQNLAGTWQGTLNTGKRDLRVIFKISPGDAASLKALMYSIDQGPDALPSSAVTMQNTAVKITFPGVGANFEGKMSADGNTIGGTWTQGPKANPLNVVRTTEQSAWEIPTPPPSLKPMAADANPAFEVATIKPTSPDTKGKGFGVDGRRFSTRNTSLADLITFAYGIHTRQIIGAPGWVESDRFDIEAHPDAEGEPNDAQWKTMLQKLIAERFQLKFHKDKKELSVFVLTPGKTAPKMTKSEGDPNGLPDLNFRGLGRMVVSNATMGEFAQAMQGAVLDRPVVDRTGIKGRYDFTLDWTADDTQFAAFGPRPPAASGAPDALPDLFTAIQQQLGLKFESTKATVEVFVIDRVEKPSAN
jgi:uncharacterized protein (TIGR03435 family)